MDGWNDPQDEKILGLTDRQFDLAFFMTVGIAAWGLFLFGGTHALGILGSDEVPSAQVAAVVAVTPVASPVVQATHLEVHDLGGCDLFVHIDWNGIKFAHKKGELFLFLRESGTPIANTTQTLNKGMVAQNISTLFVGPQSSGTYSARATFWTTRGKDGALLNRIFTSVTSADFVCE